MVKKNTTSRQVWFLTMDGQEVIEQLGQNLQIARKRRNWTQAELSKRSGVGLSTLKRLEKGQGSQCIAALVNVLTALDLEASFLDVAHPEKDELGIALERRRLPQRVRGKRKLSGFDRRVRVAE